MTNQYVANFQEGLLVSALGLIVVFFILMILWGMLELMRVVFYDLPNKRKAAAEASAPLAVEAAPLAVAPAPQAQEDEGELIAVLTAAVAAALGRPEGGLNIRSFRRIQNDTAWGRISKSEQIESHIY